MPTSQCQVIDSGLRCLNCQYNLTGLDGLVCPECGAPFDRDALLLDGELRRIGTAAHRAHGLLKIPATLLTALTVVFAPVRFARQLRVDESIVPPLSIMAVVILYIAEQMTGGFTGETCLAFLYLTLVTLAPAIPATILLAVLSSSGGSRAWRLSSRLRAFSVLFCYTSWFLLPCMAFEPTMAPRWNDLGIFWPPVWSPYYRLDDWYRTGFFVWWVAIVYCFVVVRSKPRWLALLLFPIVLGIVNAAFQIYEAFIPRLSR